MPVLHAALDADSKPSLAAGMETLADALGASWIVAVLLVSLRLGAVVLAIPLLSAATVPLSIRVLTVLGLAACIWTGLGTPGWQPPADALSLLRMALSEFTIGATLGLGVLLGFSSFSVAGRLLDLQIGFGIAQVLDPLTRRQLPIISSVLDQVAVLVFFLVSGHHVLLRGVAYSLERFPVGGAGFSADVIAAVIPAAAGVFALGFALAAPVVFCLFVLEIALGVVSRNLPQVNMFVLGVPIKTAAGLFLLSAWIYGMGGSATRIYESIYVTWDRVIGAPAPMPATGGAR